jgi:hypothetical protein
MHMFFACILFASKPAMSQDATAIPPMMSVPLPGIFDGIGPDELSNKVRHVSAARSKSLGGSLYGRQVRRMWTRVLAKNGDGDLMAVEMRMSCHVMVTKKRVLKKAVAGVLLLLLATVCMSDYSGQPVSVSGGPDVGHRL